MRCESRVLPLRKPYGYDMRSSHTGVIQPPMRLIHPLRGWFSIVHPSACLFAGLSSMESRRCDALGLTFAETKYTYPKGYSVEKKTKTKWFNLSSDKVMQELKHKWNKITKITWNHCNLGSPCSPSSTSEQNLGTDLWCCVMSSSSSKTHTTRSWTSTLVGSKSPGIGWI